VSHEIALVGDGQLGAAIGERLRADGRAVTSDPARIPELRLVLLDCAPHALAETIARVAERLDGNHLVVHCVRGEAWRAIHDSTAVRRIGVLGGPLDAAELRAGRPSAAVVASRHPEVVEEFAAALSTPRLRVYRSRDPIGVELARELVDLVVVACGLAGALELGEVARAVLVTRAVRELERMIVAVGGDHASASGLGGLGDLLVRSANPRDPALELGRALAGGGAAPDELSATAHHLRKLADEKRVQAHIVRGIALALEGKVTPNDLLAQLMTAPVLDD
jgi:glycerol-3-phosphate dehydrogenase (NAD(P)+)